MGQTIGTVQTLKISESEFSFEWHFCKVNFDFAYRSPNFAFTCKELGRCYLEMKPNVINRVLTFSLCGCKGGDGSKISSTAVLADDKTVSFKSNEYETSIDLEPSMKIFEIHLSDPMLSSCFNYIFKFKIKLHSYSTFLSSILNENTSLQSMQDQSFAIISSNEVPTSTKSLGYTTKTSTSFNEVSTSTRYQECKRDPSTASSDPEHLGFNDDSSTTFKEKPSTTEYFKNNKASSSTVRVGPRSAPSFEYTKELVEDLRCLYTSGSMCDLEIKIGEDVLYAHKLILSARSPVFKKMMEYDCSEASSNSICLTDCPTLSFKKFLKYLYTGEIEDSPIDITMALYSLGDKYNVKALKGACSGILQHKLSCESVDEVASIICDVLQLAECHNDSKLQDSSERFIVNHFPVVSKKQNWKDLMKSDFELTSKILALVATSLQKVQT